MTKEERRLVMANALANAFPVTRMDYHWLDMADAAIEAMSKPEFVLPLAEEWLRAAGVRQARFLRDGSTRLCDGESIGRPCNATLLDAYNALRGEI